MTLYQELVDSNVDMSSIDNEHMKSEIASANNDPVKQAARLSAEEELDRIRPVLKTSTTGNVTTLVEIGASGFVESRDDEELADVEVLDETASIGDCDLNPDRARIYSEGHDTKLVGETDHDDEPLRIDDTGAKWILGCRSSPELVNLLYPHQNRVVEPAIQQLEKDSGYLIAHEMGLGKTLTTLAVLETYRTKHLNVSVVICCPKQLILTWEREVERWKSMINLDVYIIPPGCKHIPVICKPWKKNGGILITNYDTFEKKHADISIDGDTIIVYDEAHHLNNERTERFKAAASLPTNKMLLLTGTPIQNKLREFYALFQLITPGLYARSWADFNDMYGKMIVNGFRYNTNEKERMHKDASLFAIRHLASAFADFCSIQELETSLPSKHEYRILYTPTPHDYSGEALIERVEVFGPALEMKTKVVVQLIDSISFNAKSDNILVFSDQLDTLKSFASERPGVVLTGETTQIDKREEMLNEFRKNGGVFYVSTGVGGEGLNLPIANHVILADPDWNPCNERQCIARCYRNGQTKEVTVYRLVADGTIEDYVYYQGMHKLNVASGVCNASTTAAERNERANIDIYRRETDPTCILSRSNVNHPILKHAMSKIDIRISKHDDYLLSAVPPTLEQDHFAVANLAVRAKLLVEFGKHDMKEQISGNQHPMLESPFFVRPLDKFNRDVNDLFAQHKQHINIPWELPVEYETGEQVWIAVGPILKPKQESDVLRLLVQYTTKKKVKTDTDPFGNERCEMVGYYNVPQDLDRSNFWYVPIKLPTGKECTVRTSILMPGQDLPMHEDSGFSAPITLR
jgi:superfamily II DNA or RNA helicase